MLASRHTTQHEEEEEAKKISVIPGYASKLHTTQHQREEEAKKISVTPGYAGKPLYDQREEEAKKISYSVYKVNNKVFYILPRQLRWFPQGASGWLHILNLKS